MYTYFEPEPLSDDISMGKGRGTEALKVSSVEKKSSLKVPASKNGSSKSSSHGKTQQLPLPSSDNRTTPNNNSSGHRRKRYHGMCLISRGRTTSPVR